MPVVFYLEKRYCSVCGQKHRNQGRVCPNCIKQTPENTQRTLETQANEVGTPTAKATSAKKVNLDGLTL